MTDPLTLTETPGTPRSDRDPKVVLQALAQNIQKDESLPPSLMALDIAKWSEYLTKIVNTFHTVPQNPI